MFGQLLLTDHEWKKISDEHSEVAITRINDELSFLEGREPDETGKYDDYHDIAISWIMAPEIARFNKTQAINEKRDFISNVISTYTSYHSNPEGILNQYDRSYLYIKNSSVFEYLHKNYQFDGIDLKNTQHDRIREEMEKGHLVLCYSVHGWYNNVEFSLNPSREITTIEDYQDFVEEHGLPALFVDGYACYALAPEPKYIGLGENYCWPPAYMECGVWAYYLLAASSEYMEKAFSTEPFIGYAIRHHACVNFVYGDITAHMVE